MQLISITQKKYPKTQNLFYSGAEPKKLFSYLSPSYTPSSLKQKLEETYCLIT